MSRAQGDTVPGPRDKALAPPRCGRAKKSMGFSVSMQRYKFPITPRVRLTPRHVRIQPERQPPAISSRTNLQRLKQPCSRGTYSSETA